VSTIGVKRGKKYLSIYISTTSEFPCKGKEGERSFSRCNRSNKYGIKEGKLLSPLLFC